MTIKSAIESSLGLLLLVILAVALLASELRASGDKGATKHGLAITTPATPVATRHRP